MPVPAQPTVFVPEPFANNGQFASIPDTKQTSGRASYFEGFPNETQLPLSSGGIAPNRLDFNGLFRVLSAALFWQQSGGQWTYSDTLNYGPTCLVYFEGQLWWCLQDNGPDATAGVIEPGTNNEYWEEFIRIVAGGSGGLTPVGTIIMYYGTTAPEGYFAMDGETTFSATDYPLLYDILGSTVVPDWRGAFIRGYDPSGVVDPDGTAREIGTKQLDAAQRFTGVMPHVQHTVASPGGSGIYRQTHSGWYTRLEVTNNPSSNWNSVFNHNLDNSRVNRTSTETRPVNMNALYCIKHD